MKWFFNQKKNQAINKSLSLAHDTNRNHARAAHARNNWPIIDQFAKLVQG